MERIKMAVAGVLMGAVGIIGLGFGLIALVITTLIGAVMLVAARIAAPVVLKRAAERMQALDEEARAARARDVTAFATARMPH